MQENRSVPEDLREQYLKYRVNIRVLGVIRNGRGDRLTFVPSHRRLPHVGSPVAFPSEEVLREIAGHNNDGAPIGHLALGEYIYADGSPLLDQQEWMQIKSPDVLIRFPIESLVSRRSFIFARAGFGKSNLNKLLFSKLYEQPPVVVKRGKDGPRDVPVGTVIFDADGEYFWPDDKGRPGLCDVPALEDKLVVFTSRQNPSRFYQSFVAGGIKLDIRRLRPADVVGIALAPERQEQQNVRKLRGLDPVRWERLVNLIDEHGNAASLQEIRQLLQLEDGQEAEALAARANMNAIVRMLHDKSSQLMDMLIFALSRGKLCVIDVSQMRGQQALILSGLILRRIFDRNQEEFTAAEPKTIPTTAVVEEAQSVLNERATSAEPYIAWVKEGRKYDLGALLITQQPGSIPVEILSQGDNWFIFHLLSAADLTATQRANAHFSEDLLAALLNEPIPGQGVFWSSVGGKPYPVPLRVLSFEKLFPLRDAAYSKDAARTFAVEMRADYAETLAQATRSVQPAETTIPSGAQDDAGDGAHGQLAAAVRGLTDATDVAGDGAEGIDVKATYEEQAIQVLERDAGMVNQIKSGKAHWAWLKNWLRDHLPETLEDRDNIAYYLVRKAVDRIMGGAQDSVWHTEKGADGRRT